VDVPKDEKISLHDVIYDLDDYAFKLHMKAVEQARNGLALA
jgi:hypothetical protein